MVYIILPVFKRVSLTNSFIESVRGASNVDVRFVIVDDETSIYSNYEQFKTNDDVIALKTTGDVWWCKTVFIGIEYLIDTIPSDEFPDDIIIIANNDVRVQSNTFNILDMLDDNCILHPLTRLKDTGFVVSSGCKVLSWFPYITKHNFNIQKELIDVDMLTARFLCMKGAVLLKNGNISDQLLQYHGDSEFTLRAKLNGINNYIVTNIIVTLDDNDNSAINQKSITNYFKSSFNETKSNSIKQKYLFLRCNFGVVKSLLIALSMFINGLVKVFLRKVRG
ncbi:hypothetical protein [Pseudoalteromonas fuliginea]|uniref:Glycosyltransferase n=1 Tax=Pseudoalteromonas fuliginea TaxID=1872678 RepID=A0ABQ6RN95_9GAMM|nr:hypothetical protein [Pseudoalteromonas fuliginea]KAA1166114.1 hypothetical protein EU509_00675 [Pseudoalteromonas fuliginea]KAA1169756.1 hypothetical protein EUZ79_00785 [Pseudoalteromonas fuliginea]